MEKKRRERINKCLEELKSIVLRAVNEESRPNKLEKADILEMTVRYLRTIKQPVHLKSDKGENSTKFLYTAIVSPVVYLIGQVNYLFDGLSDTKEHIMLV